MADYVPITDAEIEPEAPATTSLFVRLRDNAIAMITGGLDAPRVKPVQIHASYILANGVEGPDFAVASWVTHIYNTLTRNDINGASLNTTTGEITLPAGVYDVAIPVILFASGGACNFRARIHNVTDNEELLRGNNASTGPMDSLPNTIFSFIVGRFTLVGTRVVAIQGFATTGGRWGHAFGLGPTEKYGDAIITHVG